MLRQGKARQGNSHSIIRHTQDRDTNAPIESLRPLHIQHGREGGDDLEMGNDDLEAHDEGVLPLFEERDKPNGMGIDRETNLRHTTSHFWGHLFITRSYCRVEKKMVQG